MRSLEWLSLRETSFDDLELLRGLPLKTLSLRRCSALDDFAREWLQDNCPVLSFRIYKQPETRKSGEKKPSSTRKYVCPECGQSVRATKEVHLYCADCSVVGEYGDMVEMVPA